MTNSVQVRRATLSDAEAVKALIDEYAIGHPAAQHPRPLSVIRAAYFGEWPASFILVAEKRGIPIGFGAWRRIFDMLWTKYGGEMDGLYVKRDQRGRGIAAVLVAAVCADIRREGGTFLRGTYTENVGKLYERVAVGNAQKECHLSAGAFQIMADLEGCGARDILRCLPSKDLNYVVPGGAG